MLHAHAEGFLHGMIIKLGPSRTKLVENEQPAVIHCGSVDVGWHNYVVGFEIGR